MKYLPSLLLLSATALSAQDATAAAPAPAGAFEMGSFLPIMAVMFAVMYFLMIRPEQKKQKEKQALINELKKGDKVLTIGGIYGKVVSVKDETVMVKVAENTSVKISKSAVSTVVNKEKTSDTSKDSSKK